MNLKPILALPVVLTTGLHAQETSDWHGQAGLFLENRPAYMGSDESKLTVRPDLELRYKNRLFIQDDTLLPGAGTVQFAPLAGEHWSWRVGVISSDKRSEDEAKALKGMGDRDRSSYYGTGVYFNAPGLRAALEGWKGFKDEGTLADLKLGLSLPLATNQFVDFQASVLWGDAKNLTYDFGVTPEQAATRQALLNAGNTDLRPEDGKPYDLKAGLRQAQLRVAYLYKVTPKLGLIAFVAEDAFLKDVRNSPLVRSTSNTTLGLGFRYQFLGIAH